MEEPKGKRGEYTSSFYSKRFQNAIIENGDKFPHYTFPMVNKVSDCPCPPPRTETSPLLSTHPLPVLRSTTLGIPNDDPILRLVKLKEVQKNELENIKTAYKFSKRKKTIKKKKEQMKVKNDFEVETKYVQQFAEVLEKNPDKYFSGTYNWYFTGSNMIVMNMPMEDVLFHVTGEQLNKLDIKCISYLNNELKLEKSDKMKCFAESFDTDGFIYELCQDFDSQQLAVRQKFYISSLDVKNKNITKITSEVPFVSSTYEKYSKRIVTTDVARTVKIWENSKCITESSLCDTTNTLNDNWSCARGYQNNVIAYADRHRVALFDIRAPKLEMRCMAVLDLLQQMDKCEQITIIEPSFYNPNIIYVGMTHQLYAIDIRKAKKCAMLQWRHQMQSNPTMLCALNRQSQPDSEIIAMSGSVPSESRIFVNERLEDGSIRSPYMSHRPVSINDTHTFVRRKGLCLEPISMVPNQIKMSTSGIALYDSLESTLELLFQNSAGDVFAQKLFQRDEADKYVPDYKIENKLLEWDEQLLELPATNLFDAYSVTNYNTMAKCFAHNIRNPHGIGGAGMIDTRLLDEPQAQNSSRWQRSYTRLSKYTDALAADMLSVWHLEDEGGCNVANIPLASTDRISEWLSTTVATRVELDESLPPTARQLEGPLCTSTQLDNGNAEAADISQLMSRTSILNTGDSPSVTQQSRSKLNTSKDATKRGPRKFVPGF